jgi:hypothetical protein
MLSGHGASPWFKFDHMNMLKSNVVLNQHFFEWFKLVNLCMVKVLGNVEDKQMFSNLGILKNNLWNWLTTCLDRVVRMHGQKIYLLDVFPFYIAICERNDTHTLYGVEG